MESLRKLGLDAAVREVHASGKPLLGICIGCQVALEWSEEDGGTRCLGLLPGSVKLFRFPSGATRPPGLPRCAWISRHSRICPPAMSR